MAAITKRLDIANVSQRYLRDISDWRWLCRRCHMISDGRVNNLLQFKRNEVKPAPKPITEPNTVV